MSLFLLIVAGMLAISAGLKVRTCVKAGLGVTIWTLLEGATVLGMVAAASPGPWSGSPLLRSAVPVAFLVMLVSSVQHGLRLRDFRRRRAESEAERLANYVRYLADAPETPESDEEGDDGASLV